MPLYTVEEKIIIAKNSQWIVSTEIDKCGLYGGGIDLQLPRKIKAIRQNVEWMYNLDGGIEEVNATGTVTINAVGNDGDNIEVLVDDPLLGEISLGNYTKVSGDTTTTILAGHIATALSSNGYGYVVTSDTSNVDIEARVGLGSSINGGMRLSVVIGSINIVSETGNNLITESSNNIIVE